METGLTVDDLSGFTGQLSTYYDDYVIEALEQGGDLFELATELATLPESGLALRLARRAVLAMAEALYEGQQYRSLRFSPFRTQTIGSYSYALAEQSVLAGVPTKIAWFDMAVRILGPAAVVSTSVHAFDRPGDEITIDEGRYLAGPADTEKHLYNRPYG